MSLIKHVFVMSSVVFMCVNGSEIEHSDAFSCQDPEMTQIFEGSRARRLLSAERSQDVSNPVSSADSSNEALCTHDNVQAYLFDSLSSSPSCDVLELDEREFLLLENSVLQPKEEDILAARQRIVTWIYSIYFASKIYRASVKEAERSMATIDSVELTPDSFSLYANSRNESLSDASTHVFFDRSFAIAPSYQTSFWQDDDWHQLWSWCDCVPKDLKNIQGELNPNQIYNVAPHCPNPLSPEEVVCRSGPVDRAIRTISLGSAHARAVARIEKRYRRPKKTACVMCCDCSIQ
ncbi:hypothetical protein KBD08_02680 [Candidatus Babeliales bacterium]|nr:hypothetical protein [Candidatus Babeliales bacterium]